MDNSIINSSLIIVIVILHTLLKICNFDRFYDRNICGCKRTFVYTIFDVTSKIHATANNDNILKDYTVCNPLLSLAQKGKGDKELASVLPSVPKRTAHDILKTSTTIYVVRCLTLVCRWIHSVLEAIRRCMAGYPTEGYHACFSRTISAIKLIFVLCLTLVYGWVLSVFEASLLSGTVWLTNGWLSGAVKKAVLRSTVPIVRRINHTNQLDNKFGA